MILAVSLLLGKVDLVLLQTSALMLLYGIAGAYQPSVQASIPMLASQENYMAANSIINTISSFASLVGPVLGGIVYSAYGLRPVLWVCIVCFFLSAVIEIFIKMPFEKPEPSGNLWDTIKADFGESVRFIRQEKPVIGKALLVVCGINLFLSAMIIVGMPYLVTEVLDLEAHEANRLFGYAQGALAAGGLTGGICAGVFAGKLSIKKTGNLLVACAAPVFPIGLSLLFFESGMVNYLVLTGCSFLVMVCSTVFSVQMMSFIQTETPQNLLGKVIAVILTICMCAQPLGNAFYGVMFGACKGFEYVVVLFAGVVTLGIVVCARKIFENL